jgi:hypothetical protein
MTARRLPDRSRSATRASRILAVALRLLSRSVLAFLVGKLAVLLVNTVWFPTLRTDPKPNLDPTPDADTNTRSRPRVALLVPMRDEAGRLPDTLPGMLSAGADELLCYDDESTDGSGDLVRDHATDDGPPVRVLPPVARPAGWAGKTWACQQLAGATDAELLLFCDADVELTPGAVAAVVAEWERQEADVFSVFCRHRTGTWSERLLVPLIVDVLLCFLPFGLLRAPVPAAATAHGALLGFTRAAWQELDGFTAVRGSSIEDVEIARFARHSGLRLGLVLGGSPAAVRMYRTADEVVTGLARGLVPAAGGRRWPVAAGWLWHVLAYTAPVLLAPRSRAWRAAALLGIAERALLEAKTGGRDWPAAVAVGLSPVAAAPVVGRALRRRQVWKGRVVS